jgi:predicted Fe-Mo cluster-binding NifX family protein
MKIAVTSQNYRTITPHAGKTRRFLVYEAAPDKEPVEVDRLNLPKDMALHEFHGDGPHPLYAVDVVIAGSFGHGFSRRMAKQGIVAVMTNESDPVQAVRDFLASPVGTLKQNVEQCGCDHHHP